MNKNRIYLFLAVCIFMFSCGFVSAQDSVINTNPAISPATPNADVKPIKPKQVVKYTAEQQACIKLAQDTRQGALKSTQDSLNLATKSALEARQAAIKSAQEAFNSAIKDAVTAREAAIKSAQAIKDSKARAEAFKAAQNAFNAKKTVKQADSSLKAALQAAGEKYNNDANVKSAKAPFSSTLKAANEKYQTDLKACIGDLTVKNKAKKHIWDIFGNIGAGAAKPFTGLIKFLSK